MVAGQWECLPQNAPFVRKVPRLNVLQTNQKYPVISVSNCKPRSSTNVYCNLDARVFDVIALRCGQIGSGFSCTTMLDLIWQCRSKYFCQHFKSFYCHMHRIFQIFHLWVSPISTTETSIERPSLCLRSSLSDSHAKDLCRIPKLLPRTASKTSRNAGSGLWLQEVVVPLAPECQFTALIFIVLVSEVSGHGL